jgi:hypothetical protein
MILAVSPAFMIAALLEYATRARVYLGHWPSYNNPDPKNLGWFIQHAALQLGFTLFPLPLLGAVFLSIAGRAKTPDFPLKCVLGTAIVCSALLIAYCRIDPGGFVEWFWD